jgi:hypothetical protein
VRSRELPKAGRYDLGDPDGDAVALVAGAAEGAT